MKSSLTLLLFFLSQYCAFSQYEFIRFSGFPLAEYGIPLDNPWAGGFNSCQFSKIDLDLDGDQDIFVFDRDGNRTLLFLNEDNAEGAVNYKHTTDYLDAFPVMKSWVLLRDFNCDGKQDIFTNKSNGMSVYENVSTPESGLQFELRTENLQASYNLSGTPFNAGVYCLSVDIPSIQDHDGDGDLDIFTFTDAGSTVYYYQSLASDIENCDSLIFETVNRCYGFFAEGSEDNSIVKGDDFECSFNVIDPRATEDGLHSGGALLSIDVDQNGIKDLIVSDVSFRNMVALIMEESVQGPDSVVACDTIFPANYLSTEKIEMRKFPGGFYEDVNNDGLYDLIVSPNSKYSAIDDKSVWLYLNSGENDLPAFTLESNDFLQSGMIEVGRNAYPVIVDYNDDGLLDLMVANKEYFINNNDRKSKLALYENTGTPINPKFDLVSKNYMDISSLNIENAYPTFGDLDNDGDPDMIIGEQTGVMHFFRNEAAVGEDANWVLEEPSIKDIDNNILDMGQSVTPQLFDVNGDGLLDLLVGEKNGNVNYIENVGSSTEYAFEHLIDTIGGAIASNYLGINGYSVPHMFRNEEGLMELFIGSEVGYINHYNDIEDNLNGTFNLVTLVAGNIREGDYGAAFTTDINNDDQLDLFYGQNGGGVSFYSTDTLDISIPEIKVKTMKLNLYPNPTSGDLNIAYRNLEEPVSSMTIIIHDQIGRKCIEETLNNPRTAGEIRLDLNELSAGFYVVSILTGKHVLAQEKLVIK